MGCLERWVVRDDRRRAGGDADCDRELEVDDQGAEWEKRDPFPERPPRGGGVAAALRETSVELVVDRDEQDDPHDAADRRHEESEIAVEREKSGLDGVGDRGDAIAHHRERERQQKNQPASIEGSEHTPPFTRRGASMPTRLRGAPSTRSSVVTGAEHIPRGPADVYSYT